MELTAKQITATINAGIKMANADGKFLDEEKAALTMGMADTGLDSAMMQKCISSAKDMDPDEALAIISEMNESQKKFVSGFLAAIMISDGDIAEDELRLWKSFCTKNNFPTMSIKEAVEFWQKN